MLRPERMSKVSVTGSRAVMREVIEAVHDLDVLHLSEYGGEFEGFESGDPVEGADPASEKLVTVRSLLSILGVSDADAGPARIVEDLDDQLETVRTEVNDLDDRRSELRDDLRDVEDAIEAAEPFVDLGIDLDLLGGYDTLDVAVGIGDPDAVGRELDDHPDIDAHEVFPRKDEDHPELESRRDADHDTVAAFAYPAGSLDDALVGVEFSAVEVPDPGDGPVDPADYVADLEDERTRLESRLGTVESELEDLRLEHAGFLLAAEERLVIETQKAEAPLSFATTDRAFVAEGWVPTARYDEFEAALREAVGERVDVEEVERASYDRHGHTDHEAVADGGTAMGSGEPPVIQDTPDIAKPFEAFVGAVGIPNYDELDPTVILFLTFPLFFGFMIGDLGYGLIYVGIGYWMLQTFDSPALKSMGGVGMWCGGFTALFGVLYGELFGLHVLGDVLWGTAESAGLLLDIGHSPLHKGLQPKYIDWALMWLLFAVFAGIVHLLIGWTFDFVNTYRAHGPVDAVAESGSWILMALGLWSWVFSDHLAGPKPEFIFDTPLWDAALVPAEVGIAGLGVFLVGGVMVTAKEGGVGFLEAFLSVSAFGTILSYTRIAAVLVAKAGMALGVNLLAFGAYQSDDGAFHFIFFEGGTHGYEPIFAGLMNGEGAMLFVGGAVGLLVLLFGHAIVLALGVTSAGLQAVRLEYVEFFGEFYEGGGDEYEPFGYERTYTAED